MVATALENPDSPNMAKYKKKYEKIQKKIASFEAILVSIIALFYYFEIL